MNVLPTTFEELIEQLEDTFPDKCPELSDEERAIWFHAGCVYVVKHIKARLTETENQQYVR